MIKIQFQIQNINYKKEISKKNRNYSKFLKFQLKCIKSEKTQKKKQKENALYQRPKKNQRNFLEDRSDGEIERAKINSYDQKLLNEYKPIDKKARNTIKNFHIQEMKDINQKLLHKYIQKSNTRLSKIKVGGRIDQVLQHNQSDRFAVPSIEEMKKEYQRQKEVERLSKINKENEKWNKNPIDIGREVNKPQNQQNKQEQIIPNEQQIPIKINEDHQFKKFIESAKRKQKNLKNESPDRIKELQKFFINNLKCSSPQTDKNKFIEKQQEIKDQEIKQYFKVSINNFYVNKKQEKYQIMSKFLGENNINNFFQQNCSQLDLLRGILILHQQNYFDEDEESLQGKLTQLKNQINANDVDDIALLKYIEKDQVPQNTLERILHLNQAIKLSLMQEEHDEKMKQITNLQYQKNNSIFRFLDSLPEQDSIEDKFIQRNRIPQRQIETLALQEIQIKMSLMKQEEQKAKSIIPKDTFQPSEQSKLDQSTHDEFFSQRPIKSSLQQQREKFITKKPYNPLLDPKNSVISSIFNSSNQPKINFNKIEQATLFGSHYQNLMRQTKSEFYNSQFNFANKLKLSTNFQKFSNGLKPQTSEGLKSRSNQNQLQNCTEQESKSKTTEGFNPNLIQNAFGQLLEQPSFCVKLEEQKNAYANQFKNHFYNNFYFCERQKENEKQVINPKEYGKKSAFEQQIETQTKLARKLPQRESKLEEEEQQQIKERQFYGTSINWKEKPKYLTRMGPMIVHQDLLRQMQKKQFVNSNINQEKVQKRYHISQYQIIKNKGQQNERDLVLTASTQKRYYRGNQINFKSQQQITNDLSSEKKQHNKSISSAFIPYKKFQDIPQQFLLNQETKNIFNYVDSKDWQNKF